MSCGGLNVIASLNVPGVDNADGAPTDVSGMVAEKSVEISGGYQGAYIVLGSHDGLRYVPLLIFNSGNGTQSFKQTMKYTVRFMKVRRRAQALSGTVTVSIGSQAVCPC